MNQVTFPKDWRLEPLRRDHPRRSFRSGEPQVDDWLAKHALQNQEKHLSTTRVLLDDAGAIAGYFTLAMGTAEFNDLPHEITRKLPKRALPVTILAWLGVSQDHQAKGFGKRLLAQALRDCYEASHAFPFVAVILDCMNDRARAFYEHFDFKSVPGHPYKMFLSASLLEALMDAP